ncbi:MAG: hypothetical protein WD876_02605 [Candidatus Pacearchaeota archaeon]
MATERGENLKFEIIKKISDVSFKYQNINNISKLDGSSPPSVFVGSKLHYPLVNVGILSPLNRDEDAWVYDKPKFWAENNFQVNDVVKLRDSLLNSRFQSNVTDVRYNKKFLDLSQEIAVASKPVDIEIELKNKISIGREKDRVLTPHGMRGSVKNAKIVSNVKVDRKLDKIMNDDIKASAAIKVLYKNNFDEYLLSKILSIGVLGLKKNRKLVPTRWSITATDDALGKQLLENVKKYKWIENYELFYGSFLGNHYLILLFPSVWSYELFELYLPGSSWNQSNRIRASTDFEPFSGRKEYATATAGGYYASRLPIIEYLNKIKRQAGVLAIRIETPSYWASLGVWVVRESVRKALANKMLDFTRMEELLESSTKVGMIKFGYDNSDILKRSKLVEQVKTQRSLGDWL